MARHQSGPTRCGSAGSPAVAPAHASTPLAGAAPCLLYGYGAYEYPSDPEFSVGLPSLLDRGVIYAIAHVRGGGEGGGTWWRSGYQAPSYRSGGWR
ncbi:MAG TPA: hypothetical protein VFQ44_00915 [Streptosporangiaceae bacterium]|nr:hypothetical protein [Streptosporangiaceae bacterium]